MNDVRVHDETRRNVRRALILIQGEETRVVTFFHHDERQQWVRIASVRF